MLLSRQRWRRWYWSYWRLALVPLFSRWIVISHLTKKRKKESNINRLYCSCVGSTIMSKSVPCVYEQRQ